MRKYWQLFVLTFMIGSLSSCAKVEPWQREHLASPQMSYDAMPLDKTLRDHIYFSREGALGDESAAGGGCGCN